MNCGSSVSRGGCARWYDGPVQWRWLFNQFADPELGLTAEQRAKARELADRGLRRRLILYTWAVVLPPPLIGIGLIWLIDDWVAARTGLTLNAAHMVLLAVVVVLVWPWSAWVCGRLYTRPYRRALREVGVRVCEGCGYSLESLAEGTTCPECGEGEAHLRS